MGQEIEHALEQARQAVDQRDWAEAYALLAAADETATLEPEGLQLVAECALLVGRDQ